VGFPIQVNYFFQEVEGKLKATVEKFKQGREVKTIIVEE
jgi:hypothetical protein